MKETKTPAGIQLELYWVVYAVPMIADQFISMRNDALAHMKKTLFGKRAHLNYVY